MPRGHRRVQHRAKSGRQWTGGVRRAAQWIPIEAEWNSDAAFVIRSRYGI